VLLVHFYSLLLDWTGQLKYFYPFFFFVTLRTTSNEKKSNLRKYTFVNLTVYKQNLCTTGIGKRVTLLFSRASRSGSRSQGEVWTEIVLRSQKGWEVWDFYPGVTDRKGHHKWLKKFSVMYCETEMSFSLYPRLLIPYLTPSKQFFYNQEKNQQKRFEHCRKSLALKQIRKLM
jgi:hypothetical protein